jgi:Fe(3+) dicitrate transport protein
MQYAKKVLFILLICLFCLNQQGAIAQDSATPPDSVTALKFLPDVNVVGKSIKTDITHLPEIVGTQIFAGKKNSLVVMKNLQAVVVTNNRRQVLAKVPGIHIWESDGSGIQIGISARGLSPNRSWEFNIRQNGYDIASDPYGYPEAYYNPNMQAVQGIQIVRGAGSLQYGPQFGGMVNYILKDGSDIKKPIQFETGQTVGSFGMVNSYNAIGGNKGKIKYYVFHDYRQASGWRENSRYRTQSAFGTITWQARRNLSVTVESMMYNMLSQQPGGLTDAQFQANPQQSHRSRNWFATPWYTGAAKINWEISSTARLQARLFIVHGDRKSVGFMGGANIRDTINHVTFNFNNRDVAIDEYRNKGAEIGFLKAYKLFGVTQHFSAGLRVFSGQTSRFQKGKGSVNASANFETTGPFPVALTFDNFNTAIYAENLVRLNQKLIVIPGIRIENISSHAQGRTAFTSNGEEIEMPHQRLSRNFALLGVGAEYHIGKKSELYMNYSQAYRPILFSDLTQNNTTDVIDPNLTDSRGNNADIGFRGLIGKCIKTDIGFFLLNYNNRIGNLSRADSAGTIYNFRTNVGNSLSKGIELFTEVDLLDCAGSKKWGLPVFISYTHTQAFYSDFSITEIKNGNIETKNLTNRRVENAPTDIIRCGMALRYRTITLGSQFSYTASSFSDAQNTATPSANGNTGPIPGYRIVDLNLLWNAGENYTFKLTVNNATNAKYFTRRSGGYPGPGILPSDSRSFLLSISGRF